MVFSSPVFLFLFLPAVIAVYFPINASLRNAFLLFASLLFYAWGETTYVLLMLAAIVANYCFGILLDKASDGARRTLLLSAALSANLLLLGTFKYANFIVDNLNGVIARAGIAPIELAPVHLPIGISFFTFQAMSYVFDVYRRVAPAQKNPINIALYISLFPQLIAGPIVRYHDVAKQLVSRSVDMPGVAYGVRRFIIGLAKKVLIANIVGRVADDVFALDSTQLTPAIAWVGIVAYSLQIYFDFSGYSDMAIGLGRMFGFRFLENFNYPYISQSLTEFWRRWHISLSSWFRDYLYIPLGGNRQGKIRTYFNLITVFFLCGLWHGAHWNFVIWGLYHGSFLVVERMGLAGVLDALWRPIRHTYVILVFMVGWVFFRVETLGQATNYLAVMMGLSTYGVSATTVWFHLANEDIAALLIGIVAATPVLPAAAQFLNRSLSTQGDKLPVGRIAIVQTLSIIALCALYLGSILRLAAGTHNPFIYFRF